MTPRSHRFAGGLARGRVAVLVVALSSGGLALSSCAIVKAAKKIASTVESNKSTIDAFTAKIQSGEGSAFEAAYVTSGSAPATIVYAVQPPQGLAVTETPSHGGANSVTLDIVVNSSGEYSCMPPASSGSGSGSAWTCEKLGTANAASENKIFGLYTPAHWVSFLRTFSLAAAFAGDKVTSSSMTVNGFPMSCVDFRASGIPGTSTICTTEQGILGYVKVASDSTSFELKSYSSSPAASLFDLPAGAKVVTPTTQTS